MVRTTPGPGPGKYYLPPTIGYKDHDISRFRNYQYSMGMKTAMSGKSLGPGPKYDVYKMTCYGKASPPAYSMKSRPQNLRAFQTPGPGTYKPELAPRMKEPRPPMYSMAQRHPALKGFQTPGPDRYQVPTTIGPKVPDKHANAAFSMSFRHSLLNKNISPGPAQYLPTDSARRTLPKYTMSPRVYPPVPGPKTPGPIYLPKLPKKPGYSFGLRTDVDPYITPDDDMPCVNK